MYKELVWSIEFFEWFPNVFIRLYYAEPATGTWVILYKAPPGSELGIHRHFGDVWGFTLSGLWGYHEHKHEWMNRPYDLVYETPGAVHTLFVDPKSPEEMLTFFIVEGALEFIDEYGQTISHEDWMSITQKYYKSCKEKGIKCHDVTNPRGKSPTMLFKSLPAQNVATGAECAESECEKK